LIIDIDTGIIAVKADMFVGRFYHAVVHTGNYIFVIGGCNTNYEGVSRCERYSIPVNKWIQLPARFDEYGTNVSLVVIKKRFLLAFGG